jgi:extracellular factor (EF) 3-hydroxypalmitic acid methyl ester biosynthesis protein
LCRLFIKTRSRNILFDKPRNYAGDAELIDYMYGLRQPAPETSELGRRIFDWGGRQPTTESVRERRKIIAAMIDADDLRILSIACGHLREAAISKAVTNGKVADYFALDQDALSLEVVKNELAKFNVNPVHAPIKSLFTNGKQFHDLNFVYAAGLYDYLPQKVAVRLTNKMFQMLKPNGRLLVGNFALCVRDIGYMEAFMQWDLIYRTEAKVADFASEIPKDAIANSRMFWDKQKNVIYLEVIKK